MATSLQSKFTGCAGVALPAGEISVGAAGVVEAGFTVSTAVRVTPANTAEIVAEVEDVTEVVVTVKVALLAPAGTVTLAGTLVALELSDSDTTVPPLGAAPVRVTVPVEALPPVTLVGLRLNAESVGPPDGGLTVSGAVRVTPPKTAETVADVAAVTEVVVTVKVLLVAPAGTVTLAGTLVALEFSESDTTAPPLGAAPVRVTVPVEVLPPVTLLGLRLKAESVGPDGGGLTVIDVDWNPLFIWAEI